MYYYKDFCFKFYSYKIDDCEYHSKLSVIIDSLVDRLINNYSSIYHFINEEPKILFGREDSDFLNSQHTLRIRFKADLNGDKS